MSLRRPESPRPSSRWVVLLASSMTRTCSSLSSTLARLVGWQRGVPDTIIVDG